MRALLCTVTGYLLGSISPSSAISKRKCTDLRENGTGNLGATNTMLVLGKWYGIIVMIIDLILSMVRMKITGKLMTTWKLDFENRCFLRCKYRYRNIYK